MKTSVLCFLLVFACLLLPAYSGGLVVSDPEMSNTTVQGVAPMGEEWTISHTEPSLIPFEVSANVGWLIYGPTNGTCDDYGTTASLDYETESLPAGTHTGVVTVLAEGVTNSVVDIDVTVTIIPTSALIAYSPASLRGRGNLGQTNTTEQVINIWNAGDPSIVEDMSYTLSESVAWLTIPDSSGSSTGQCQQHSIVFTNIYGIPQGSYTTTVEIATVGLPVNHSKYLEVILDIGNGQPLLYVSTDELTVSTTQGLDTANATFYIENWGGETLSYTVESTEDWLTTSPTNDTILAQTHAITNFFNSSNLPAGTNAATLIITAPDTTNSPQVVSVEVVVEPYDFILASSGDLTHSVPYGSSISTQYIEIWNVSTGALPYNVYPGQSWLTITPNHATSTGERVTHRLEFDVTSQLEGTYTDYLQVYSDAMNAINEPLSIDVTLEVAADFQLDPVMLSNTVTEGGTATAQHLEVWNAGSTMLQEFYLAENADWLDLSQTFGESAGDTNSITLTYDTTNLAAGIYDTLVTVTATHFEATIPVHLEVVPPLGGFSERIVFASNKDGEIGSDYNIWIMDADGSNIRPLIVRSNALTQPLISPDGSKLAYTEYEFASGESKLMVRDLATQLDAEYDAVVEPRWLADSSGLVGSDHDDYENLLRRVDLNGSNTLFLAERDRQIMVGEGRLSGEFYYMADAGNIRARTIRTYDPASGLSAELIGNDGAGEEAGKLSPDEQYICYERPDSGLGNEVYIVDLESKSEQLISQGFWTSEHEPCFSPDGQHLVFRQWSGGATNSLWIADLSGTNEWLLYEVQDRLRQPDWGLMLDMEPRLSVNPVALTNVVFQGSDNVVTSSFEVWNSGNGQLHYTMAGSGRSWVDSNGGSSTGEHDTVNVAFNAGSLFAGLYTTVFTVATMDGLETQVDAVGRVAPPVSVVLTMEAIFGGGTTNDGQLRLFSDVWNNKEIDTSFSMFVDQPSWISVVTNRGNTGDDGFMVELIVDTTAMAEGVHTARLQTAWGSTTNETIIQFHIQGLENVNEPVLEASPLLLTNAIPRFKDATNQEFMVWNSGGRRLYYQALITNDWLQLRPSLSPTNMGWSVGYTNTYIVDFDTTNLGQGMHYSDIAIVGSNMTQTVSVALDVTEPERYTLGITPWTGGGVQVLPDQSNYVHGTSVQLTATNGADYVFARWTGRVISRVSQVTSIVMDRDQSAGAIFDRRTKVFGLVTNDYTGEPVEDATVRFGAVGALTDASGYYEIYPETEELMYRVERGGYIPLNWAITNLPSEATTQVNLGLTPSRIRNVSATQWPSTRDVMIQYDLYGLPNERVDVEVEASQDGGVTWGVDVNTLSGNIGSNATPGLRHVIRWQAGSDFWRVVTNMMVRVIADGSWDRSLPFSYDTAYAPSITFRVYADLDDEFEAFPPSHIDRIDGAYDVGEELADAEVYYGGRDTNYLVGVTDTNGLIQVPGPIRVGDVLFARKMMGSQDADKNYHAQVDSVKWRMWLDSDVGGPEDSDWDGVWDSKTIGLEYYLSADRGVIADLPLRHALFEYNMTIRLPPPDARSIPDLEEQLLVGLPLASKYLYELTYGQCKFHKFYLATNNASVRRNADIQIHKGIGRANAHVEGMHDPESDLDISLFEYSNATNTPPRLYTWGRVLVHEMGHYTFGFYDEYLDGYGHRSAWNRQRASHPEDYPDNYGFMQNQSSSHQMSSKNDYLADSRDYPAPYHGDIQDAVTEQIWQHRMNVSESQHAPCWTMFKSQRQNAALGLFGRVVDIIGPEPGHFANAKSSTEDRGGTFTIPAPYTVCEIKLGGESWTQIVETTRSTSVKGTDPIFVRVEKDGLPVANARVVVRPAASDPMFVVGKTGSDGRAPIGQPPSGSEIEAYWRGQKVSCTVASRRTLDLDLVLALPESPPAGVKSLPLATNTLGMTVNGVFNDTNLIINLKTSLPLSTNPTVIAYQDYQDEVLTNAISMTEVSPTEYEGTVLLTNGTSGTMEISCVSTDALTLDTMDSFGLFPVRTNTYVSQLDVTPSIDARKLDTRGLYYNAYGPVTLPAGHTLPTNQIGYAVYATLQNGASLNATNTFSLNLDYTAVDAAGIDETTLILCRWDDSSPAWIPVPCSTSIVERSVSATLTNSGLYVLLADPSSDTTPPSAIEDLVATRGANPWKVSLEWTAPGDDGTNGTAVAYELSMSTEEITNSIPSNPTVRTLNMDPQAAGSAESTTLMMEDSDQQYFLALQARDEAGNLGPVSNATAVVSAILDSDGDHLPDQAEGAVDAERNEDSDGDGLSNWAEYLLKTDPNAWDTDGDGLGDGYEDQYGLDPHSVLDRDEDSDNDGLSNKEEHDLLTNPNDADTDGDGIDDGWEDEMGLDPLSTARACGGDDDPDSDTFDNYAEFIADTIPTDGGSYLALDSVAPTNLGPVIEFWSSSRRIYDLDYAGDLVNGMWQPLLGSFYGNDMEESITDTNDVEHRIYRVRVRKP